MMEFWDRFMNKVGKVLEFDESRAVESFLRRCLPRSRLVFGSYEDPIRSMTECRLRIENEMKAMEYLDQYGDTSLMDDDEWIPMRGG